MCTRPTPNYQSVSASASALAVSALNVCQALVLLVVALITAPVRHFARLHQPRRPAALGGVDVQVHLGDPACLAELESIVWKTLRGAQQTWAPLPLPLDRVVVGAGFPATGRADIYDDFLELADGSVSGESAPTRRIVVSLGVRDGTRDLDGWEIAGALAAQIQLLVDDHCRQHRTLSPPAATVTQVTTRLARPATVEGREFTDETAPTRQAPPPQPMAAVSGASTESALGEDVPSLAALLATVQKGQPLVAAGPTSNGTHP